MFAVSKSKPAKQEDLNYVLYIQNATSFGIKLLYIVPFGAN